MPRVRRHLSRLVGVWLVFQMSLLLVVPATICAGHDEAAIAQSCTCAHGDGSQCPMHHPTPTSHAPCTCHSGTTPPTATLAAAFGPAAVLTPAASLRICVVASPIDPAAEQISADVPVQLDPPPPRV